MGFLFKKKSKAFFAKHIHEKFLSSINNPCCVQMFIDYSAEYKCSIFHFRLGKLIEGKR